MINGRIWPNEMLSGILTVPPIMIASFSIVVTESGRIRFFRALFTIPAYGITSTPSGTL